MQKKMQFYLTPYLNNISNNKSMVFSNPNDPINHPGWSNIANLILKGNQDDFKNSIYSILRKNNKIEFHKCKRPNQSKNLSRLSSNSESNSERSKKSKQKIISRSYNLNSQSKQAHNSSCFIQRSNMDIIGDL